MIFFLVSAILYIDFLDTLEDQKHSSEHLSPQLNLRPATTSHRYLSNGLSRPTLLRSPPPSFSFSAAALTPGHHLTLPSSHLPCPPRHPTAGPHTAFSLSPPSAPLCYLSAAGFHSSAVTCLPDKQKPTIEKAVDIVKEKKKKVVDTLTKVHLSAGSAGWLACLLKLLTDLLC